MKEIPWSQLTIGDLLRFQKDFQEKGIVTRVDGDKKVMIR